METSTDQERQHQLNRRDHFRKQEPDLSDLQLSQRVTEYEAEVTACNAKLDALALHTEVLRAQLNAVADLAEVEMAKRSGADRLAQLAESKLLDRTENKQEVSK